MHVGQVITSHKLYDGGAMIEAYAVIGPLNGGYQLSYVFCPERGDDMSVKFHVSPSEYRDVLLALNSPKTAQEIIQEVYLRSSPLNPRRVQKSRFN